MSSESKRVTERRAGKRFPISLNLQYRVLNRRAPKVFRHGKTINMSRHGVLFMDDEILTVGTKVEAHIHWPVKLDGNLPLKLILFGSIVRLEAGRAAFVFKRHEFRIYRQKSQAVTRHEAVLR